MNQLQLKTKLEIVTNVAVLLAASVILGNFAWTHFAKKTEPHLARGLRRGDVFPMPSGIRRYSGTQTLLLALSSSCEHCNESIPFFKQLLQINAAHGEGTQIVAVFPEAAEEVQQYVSAQQFQVQTIPGINLQTLRLAGTPSAVLLSGEGKIINFWVGTPSKEAEKEIIESITHRT